MRLAEVDQVLGDDWWQRETDLLIVASGYEERATSVASLLREAPIRRRLALGFPDRRDLARDVNDACFHEWGFQLATLHDSHAEALTTEILRAVGEAKDKRCRIVVDYSSMTRDLYAEVLRILGRIEGTFSVECYFAYTPSFFSEPKPPTGNLYVAPIAGFSNLQLPDRPTALIVGLGYEERRALGLVDYVEAAESYAFLADPGIDDRFLDVVEQNNQFLLSRLGDERLFRYPLADLRATAAVLSSVALGLAEDFRVILAPLGPKPFSLLCLLLAFRFRRFDVWRVSSGAKGNVYERPAYGAPLVLRTLFCDDGP